MFLSIFFIYLIKINSSDKQNKNKPRKHNLVLNRILCINLPALIMKRAGTITLGWVQNFLGTISSVDLKSYLQ